MTEYENNSNSDVFVNFTYDETTTTYELKNGMIVVIDINNKYLIYKNKKRKHKIEIIDEHKMLNSYNVLKFLTNCEPVNFESIKKSFSFCGLNEGRY